MLLSLWQKMTLLTWKNIFLIDKHNFCNLLAQFKQDQKYICPSPLTTVQIFSKIRSHEVHLKGHDFGTVFNLSAFNVNNPRWCLDSFCDSIPNLWVSCFVKNLTFLWVAGWRFISNWFLLNLSFYLKSLSAATA